jgi:hypothetical protein
MNTIRCFFLGAILVIYSATFALGGEIQFPGQSDPTTTATPTALTAVSTSYDQTQPTSTEEFRLYGRTTPAQCLWSSCSQSSNSLWATVSCP